MNKRYLTYISLFVSFVAVMLFQCTSIRAATVVDSGTCGDNLTWELTDDGTLTISGTGTMTDYNENSNLVPWFTQRSKITSVIINDGVENIGWDAFYRCSMIKILQSRKV